MMISRYCSENMKIVEDLRDYASCGRTYGNLGNVYYLLGAFGIAVTYHKKRLDVARQFGDRPAMRRAYTNLGNCHIYLKQIDKAMEYYRLGLAMAQELNDEVAQAQCCFNVGNGAAISGDYGTAAEFHTRRLSLARKLRDYHGEAQAYATLAVDYSGLNELGKAVYFSLLQLELAQKLNDSNLEVQARHVLEDLFRKGDMFPTSINDLSCISIDSSCDPDPRPQSALDATLKTFLSGVDHLGCSASTNSAETQSIISLSLDERVGKRKSRIDMDDDFFDLLSRMQSKRINDQRCDPLILHDLTNRTKDIVRQSDTLVCNTVSNSSVRSSRRNHSRRLSNIIERFGRAARHSAVFSSTHSFTSFLPSSTSTPRSVAVTERMSRCWSCSHPSANHVNSANNLTCGQGASRTTSLPFSLPECASEKSHDVHNNGKGLSIDTSNESPISLSEIMAVPENTNTSSKKNTSEKEFRVPEVPPRRRNRAGPNASSSATPRVSQDEAEGMLDLIESLQGRRMEEQRAHLSNQRTVSSSTNSESLSQSSDAGLTPSEQDARNLYEIVIRSQEDRINEQRSELPKNAVDDNISDIIMHMQRGRMNDQRATMGSASNAE
ncbi:hypothetical protein AB6A40_001642 [Gnathostoma spinigerum]|uniref:G-protein-signaling modulator 2 n=1 Tax=Gnathostoma spinigerum TaxID=75299 RepID=A0ABD6E4L9_9BILA